MENLQTFENTCHNITKTTIHRVMKQTVTGSLDTLLLGPGLTIVMIYPVAEIYASKRATYIMYIMANLAKSAVQQYTQKINNLSRTKTYRPTSIFYMLRS